MKPVTSRTSQFVAWLILRSWRLRQNGPPKRRLTLSGVHGVISQKIERTLHSHHYENPKSYKCLEFVLFCFSCQPWIQYCIKHFVAGWILEPHSKTINWNDCVLLLAVQLTPETSVKHVGEKIGWKGLSDIEKCDNENVKRDMMR
jgi:hypothetical protein